MSYIDRTFSDISDTLTPFDHWGKDRELKVFTGIEGMEIYNKILLKSNTDNLVDWLFEKSLIASDEQERLKEMIWSEDEDNFTVAYAIVEQKFKENQKS
jgi:hypothetical protein